MIFRMEGINLAKVRYEGSDQFKPISAWGYVGYTILFAIPVLGFILLIVFALSSGNINRRNLARSYWCILLVVVIAALALSAMAYFGVGDVRETLTNTFPQMRPALESLGTASRERGGSTSAGTVRTENATKRPTAAATAKPAAASQTKASASSGTSGVRKEVKDAIDGYEKFFNDYVAFMKKYASSSNPLSMMKDYTRMLQDYANNMEKWGRLGDELEMNDAELKYYAEATLRIEKTLMSVN